MDKSSDQFREVAVPRRLSAVFSSRFGADTGVRIFRAPGRVNLIGEHTDYNEGFVLPAAIDLYTWTAIAPRDDRNLAKAAGSLERLRSWRCDHATECGRSCARRKHGHLQQRTARVRTEFFRGAGSFRCECIAGDFRPVTRSWRNCKNLPASGERICRRASWNHGPDRILRRSNR